MQTSKEHDNCEALKSLRTGNEARKWESKYILKEETRTQGTKKQRKASKPSKWVQKATYQKAGIKFPKQYAPVVATVIN